MCLYNCCSAEKRSGMQCKLQTRQSTPDLKSIFESLMKSSSKTPLTFHMDLFNVSGKENQQQDDLVAAFILGHTTWGKLLYTSLKMEATFKVLGITMFG